MNDLISRQDAIRLAEQGQIQGFEWQFKKLCTLPSAEPKRPSEIQDILNYLDTVLHPIISPEHWNVYSELHDMISTLPSAELRKRGKWVKHSYGLILKSRWGECSVCGNILDFAGVNAGRGDANYCPNCGADMRGEEDE